MKEKLTNEIIERAMKGDRAAYDVIYRRCEGKLRTYITSHLNDKSQADDVLQNTFMSVYDNISRLKSPDAFKKWIYTIAYNECMTVNKAVSRQQQRSFSLNASYGSDDDDDEREAEFADDSIELPEEYATNKELQKLLIDTLNGLPQKQRDCVILYYYQKLPISEIAERLGTSESSVKTHKGKALESLKKKLDKYRKDYRFAFVPMGTMLGKLTDITKVKSKYTALSGAAVGHTMSAGTLVGATATAAVIGVGAITVNYALEDIQSHGDMKRNDSFAVTQRVDPESVPDASSLFDIPNTDSTSDDSAPTDSEYTIYDESDPPEYYTDSNLEINTDSPAETDGTDTQTDESRPEPENTDSEPERPRYKDSSIENVRNLTLREYMSAGEGNWKLTTMTEKWYPYLTYEDNDEPEPLYGIENTSYPDIVFIPHSSTESINNSDVTVFKESVFSVSRDEFVNLESAIEYDKTVNPSLTVEEIKTLRGEKYDKYNGLNFLYDSMSYDYIFTGKAKIFDGVTVGMTFNEIKNILGDNLGFGTWRSDGKYYGIYDEIDLSSTYNICSYNGIELVFEFTQEDIEKYNAFVKEMSEQGQKRYQGFTVPGIDPKCVGAYMTKEYIW